MACELVNPAFLAYRQELVQYIQQKLGSTEDAEEVLHEVFLKVYRHCESLPELANPRAWLYTITRNALSDYWRSQARHRLQIGTLAEDDGIPESLGQEAELAELEPLIPRLMACLPASYAQALQLADIEGKPQLEVAQQLGLSLSGAKSRIQRGRLLLQEKFKECLHLELDSRGRPQSFLPKSACQNYLSEPASQQGNELMPSDCSLGEKCRAD